MPDGRALSSCLVRPPEARRVVAVRDHAQAAAADGWPVGPLRSGDKRPVPGVDSWAFTTDPAAIDAWGWRWEGANLGGRCGESYVAIDVDPAESSEQTIADLAD